MFDWLKRGRKRKTTTAEIVDCIRNNFSEIITKNVYVPPNYRCSRWILLSGPAYRDAHFRGSVLLESRKLYEWATNHAKNTWCSVGSEQQAKEHFPAWVQDADPLDESVTLLNKSQKSFLQNYSLTFIRQGSAVLWCPDCKELHSSIQELEHDSQKLGSVSKWVAEWRCPSGHLLYVEDLEVHWIE